MNLAILMGNLGNDPDIRTLDNGDKVANFSLATNERWKDKATGEKRERVEWHRVAAFGPIVGGLIEPHLKKGDSVLVKGAIRTRKWQDQSGQDRYTTEIVVSGFGSSIEFAGKGGGGGGDDKAKSQADAYRDSPGYQGGDRPDLTTGQGAGSGEGFDDGEIPF